MNKLIRAGLLRPAIIDIEASGFGPQSYPIEVGVVLSDGHRFSRLIKPFPDWEHWSDQAQTVHRITKDQLWHYGHDGADICDQLNQFVGSQTLFSDAWVHDKAWLDTLYYRSHKVPTFSVSPLEAILGEDQAAHWEEVRQEVFDSFELRRHRASQDAFMIQEVYSRSCRNLNQGATIID